VSISASGTSQKDSVARPAKAYESMKCCHLVSVSHRTLLSDVSMDAMEAPMIANALIGLGYPTSSSLDDDAPNLGPVVCLSARIGMVFGAKTKPEQEVGLRGAERAIKFAMSLAFNWGNAALRSILDGVALNPARQINPDLQPPEITHLFDMAEWFQQMTGHTDLVRTLRAAVDAGKWLPDRFGNFDLPLLEEPSMEDWEDLFHTTEGVAATATDADGYPSLFDQDNAGSSALELPPQEEEDEEPAINPTRPGDRSAVNSPTFDSNPAPQLEAPRAKRPKVEQKMDKDRRRSPTPLESGKVAAVDVIRYVPLDGPRRIQLSSPQMERHAPAMTPSVD